MGLPCPIAVDWLSSANCGNINIRDINFPFSDDAEYGFAAAGAKFDDDGITVTGATIPSYGQEISALSP